MPQKELIPEPLSADVMDIRAAAKYLLVAKDTLYKYACDGFVPAFKLGNRWRFKKTSLDKWILELEEANKISSLLEKVTSDGR